MKMPGEELAIRLWDTVEKLGIGFLLPLQIRRVGNAEINVEARRIIHLAKAKEIADGIKTSSNTVTDMRLLTSPNTHAAEEEGSAQNLEKQQDFALLAFNSKAQDQMRKDINVAKAVFKAESYLIDDENKAPDTTIDTDWLHRWREAASTTSNEEMQDLWGRLLAGQIKNPNSFSLRSIEALKNFTQDDAKLVERIATYVISDHFIYNANGILPDFKTPTKRRESRIPFGILMKAAELGIIVDVQGFGSEKRFGSRREGGFENIFGSRNKIIIVTGGDATAQIKVPTIAVTSIGTDILKLCSVDIDNAYFEDFAKYVSSLGFKVHLADITDRNQNDVQFTNEREIVDDA